MRAYASRVPQAEGNPYTEKEALASLESAYSKSSREPATGGQGGKDWPDPQPLPDALPPVMRFDFSLLPEAIRPWIEDITQRVQCPPDFPGVAAMVALAGVVGRKVGIRPKRRGDWLVVPNLWGAAIGRPGIMKSPAIQETLKPLVRLEIQAKGRFDDAMKGHQVVALVAEQQRKEAEKAIRKAIQDGRDPAAVARSVLGDDTEAPVRRRYLVNDSTVEKLGELLNENPNGLICYRDELIGLLRSLDKEGQEGARAFYLEAWNGTGRYTYDRISRGTIDIEAAIISVFGAIQPGPLEGYLHGAVESGTTDDGLLQRFQLAVWPDVSRRWENIDRWPDSEARDRAFEVFTRLDALKGQDLQTDLDKGEVGATPFLRFTKPAQQEFDQWRADLERKVRSGEEHPAMESHLAKYRSLIPSLALLIHLADGGTGGVGVTALRRAIGWGEYLETHARRIYAVAINPDVVAARALLKKIIAGDLKDGFALRDVYRPCWSGLSSRDAAARAVAVLVDLDYLAEKKEATGGAPRRQYLVNPKIYSTPPIRTDKTDTPPSGKPPSAESVAPKGGGEGPDGGERESV